MMNRIVLGAALLAGLLAAAPAQSAITALGAGVLTPGGPVIDFNSPVQPNGTLLGNVTLGGIGFSGGGRLYTGTVSGISATPFGDTTQYLSVLGGGAETLNFSQLNKHFGLLWGSIDSYNKIQFFNGATMVNSFTGSQVASATGLLADGGQLTHASNRYIQFAFGASGAFDRVVLRSSSNSFEFDNISAAVPEPATWAMMLIGFAGLGYAARRRRQTLGA